MNSCVAFKTNELVSSTQLVKNFKFNMDNIVSKAVDKIAILRNNKPEAVVISIDEYEKLVKNYEMMEHINLYHTIKRREESAGAEYISEDKMLEKLGISKDEL